MLPSGHLSSDSAQKPGRRALPSAAYPFRLEKILKPATVKPSFWRSIPYPSHFLLVSLKINGVRLEWHLLKI